MRSNVSGTAAIFYAVIGLTCVSAFSILPITDPLEKLEFYNIPYIFIAIAALIGVLFVRAKRSVTKRIGTYGSNQSNRSTQIQSVLLLALSLSLAAIMVFTLLGKQYLFLMIITLSPVEFPLFYMEEKLADFNRIRKGFAATSFVIVVVLAIFTLSTFFNPLLVIGGLSLYSVVRTFGLSEPVERIRQNGYNSSVALLSPGYLGSFILLFNLLGSSGTAVVIALILFLLIFVSVLLTIRRKKFSFGILYSLLVLATVYSILHSVQTFAPVYTVSLIALFSASIYMMFFDSLDSKFHNIWKSMKLLPKGALFPVFLVFSAIGLIGFVGFSAWNLSIFYPGNSFNNLDQVATTILVISILLLIAATGSKLLNPVGFALLALLFIYGVFEVVSLNFNGLWTPGFLEAVVISGSISLLVLYEPTFRFTRSYSSNVPVTLSISHRLGFTRYLHSRYDVNLEKNKRSNKDLLGSGGFAYVFKGRDMSTGETVVVKTPRVYDEEGKNEREKKEFMQDSTRQLKAEKDVLSILYHPTIVRFVDYFKENNEYYLVEEYAEGRTTESFLAGGSRQGVKFDEEKVLSIAKRLIFALNYMHMHEVFHRDLNPSNILITKQGPKIIDFGTSKSMIGKGTRSFFAHSERIGVPCYNPPELEIGTSIEASPSYDTYSLGAVMCSLFTGTFLDGDQIMVKYGSRFITERYLKEEISDKVSADLYRIMRKMLAFRPEDRYTSAVSVIAELFNLNGEMVITHMGDIYMLDRQTTYSIILSGDESLYVQEGRIIRDNQIFIYEHGRQDVEKWGELRYDNMQRGYYFKAEPRKGIYGKDGQKTSERKQVMEMKALNIYTYQQDVTSGGFCYNVRRI